MLAILAWQLVYDLSSPAFNTLNAGLLFLKRQPPPFCIIKLYCFCLRVLEYGLSTLPEFDCLINTSSDDKGCRSMHINRCDKMSVGF